MNFVQNIFNNPQSNFDPLNFIGIIVTVLASVYIFKVETSVSLLKEQYEKLFFPLFNVLEPILFQGPDENILACALKIIENNKQLADGKLISLYYYYLQNPTKKTLQTYAHMSIKLIIALAVSLALNCVLCNIEFIDTTTKILYM